MEVYLDHAATTRPYERVIDRMAYVMRYNYGNPSAQYELGNRARMIVENARNTIAEDLNCDPEQIIFTSGASESNSMMYQHIDNVCGPVYQTGIEHDSVCAIDLPGQCIDKYGNILTDELHKLTAYYNHHYIPIGVCIQAANSEIGTIQDIKRLRSIINGENDLFHCDATQFYPEQKIDVQDWNIDSLCVSAHKFGGPKGVGFLYIKNPDAVAIPLIYGHQENGLRGGTTPTELIAGMETALLVQRQVHAENVEKVKQQRQAIWECLRKYGAILNGPALDANRLSTNLNVRIPGLGAEAFIVKCSLLGIYLSKGSACSSDSGQISKTLNAIGLTQEDANSTLRITLGYDLTDTQIKYVIKTFNSLLRGMV